MNAPGSQAQNRNQWSLRATVVFGVDRWGWHQDKAAIPWNESAWRVCRGRLRNIRESCSSSDCYRHLRRLGPRYSITSRCREVGNSPNSSVQRLRPKNQLGPDQTTHIGGETCGSQIALDKYSNAMSTIFLHQIVPTYTLCMPSGVKAVRWFKQTMVHLETLDRPWTSGLSDCSPRLSVPSNGYGDIVRRILSGMYPRLKGCSVKGAVRGTRVPRSRVSGVRRWGEDYDLLSSILPSGSDLISPQDLTGLKVRRSWAKFLADGKETSKGDQLKQDEAKGWRDRPPVSRLQISRLPTSRPWSPVATPQINC